MSRLRPSGLTASSRLFYANRQHDVGRIFQLGRWISTHEHSDGSVRQQSAMRAPRPVEPNRSALSQRAKRTDTGNL